MTSPDLGFAGFAMSLFGRKCEKFDSSLYFHSSPVWKWSNHSDSSFLLPLQAALILTSDDIHSVLIASSPHQPELAVTIDISKARKAENMSRHLGDLGDLGDLGGRGCSPEIAAKLDWSRAASLEYSSDHNPQ